MSLVRSDVEADSSRIFPATTPKALPCPPAWAAMRAALRARTLVCCDTFSIRSRMSPMARPDSSRWLITSTASEIAPTIASIPSMVDWTRARPFSASWRTTWASFSDCWAALSTVRMETVAFSMEALVSSAAVRSSLPPRSTCWIERRICSTATAASDTCRVRTSAFSATSAMLVPIS